MHQDASRGVPRCLRTRRRQGVWLAWSTPILYLVHTNSPPNMIRTNEAVALYANMLYPNWEQAWVKPAYV